MKTHFLLAILHCAYILSAQSDIHDHEHHSRISIQDPDEVTIAKLQRAGIDLACGSHISIKNGIRTLEVECSQSELHALTDQSISHRILISNVGEFYAHRAMANLGIAKHALSEQKRDSHVRRSVNESCPSHQYHVPSNFVLGDLGGFLYYQQILDVLDSMAMLYPHLITVKAPVSDSIHTRQGRSVYWVKISDQPYSDEAEPEVLYTALTHAREPAGAMSLLYYMWYLLENYESSPEVQRILDHTELYFIPVVNPDGYLHNESISPSGGGMWRKNLHDNNANTFIDGQDGVDLNRNYGYLWGLDDIGSSSDPSVSTYRGEAAFSEPETRMVRDFVIQHDFVTAMNDHSYGNDLYHAWEHGPSPLPDAEMLYRISDLMTWDNRYLFGESHNTYWLGAINGGANDWFYGEETLKPRIFSWLPEIGTAFWPDPLDIVQICSEQVMPHMMVAKVAGQHAVIHDLNSSELTYGINTLTFRIENLGLQQSNYKLSLLPLSEGISGISIQEKGNISFREILDSKEITVQISIDQSIADGEEIEIELLLNGEEYQVSNLRYTGVVNPKTLVSDDVSSDNLENWKTDLWGVSTDPIDPEVKWITDSRDGPQLNVLSAIEFTKPVNLKDVSWAKVNFQARWSIETTHDYVQFQMKAGGGEWKPMCGRYTKSGATGNLIDVPSPHAGQPFGKPVYDGRQLQWIQEQIDLSDFVGFENIEFRFVAWSGGNVSEIVEDGFYFRGFKIYSSRKLHCNDHILNADEADIDCGGFDCAPCPTCTDGILNGNEEEVDCGGDLCISCPSCIDGIQNQDEQGVDCGGACITCATCNDGILNSNETDIDCGGACIPCATCNDGILNGNETGMDCGGDCVSCKPTCSDGIMNGDEENIDCGGICAQACKTFCCESDINYTWYRLAGLSINISPNPASDQLSIRSRRQEGRSDNSNSLLWEIMDMRGVHIAEGEMQANGEAIINVSNLKPQLYLIRIADPQGSLVVQRFLKQD